MWINWSLWDIKNLKNYYQKYNNRKKAIDLLEHLILLESDIKENLIILEKEKLLNKEQSKTLKDLIEKFYLELKKVELFR